MDSPVGQEGRIESGGSVATAMLDLAYTNNKSHCDNSINVEHIEE